MSIFDRLLGGGRRASASPPDERASVAKLNWPQLLLGEIAGEGALRSPTALAAVRAISETAGTLPLHVFKVDSDGQRQRDRNNPVDGLLNRRPNPWTGPNELRTALVRDALLHGRGLAVAIRSGPKVAELHRVRPGTYAVDCTGIEPVYKIPDATGVTVERGWRDVVDVLAPGGTVDRPVNLTNMGRIVIGLDIAMTTYFEGLLRDGARPSAVISSESPISPDKLKEFKSWVVEQVKDGGIIALPSPIKFDQLTFSSVDLEFSAMAAAVRGEIAKVYRIPPTLVGELGRATWSNASAMGMQFLQALLPWLASVEFAFSRVLLGADQTAFLEHQVFELVKPDVAALYAAGRAAVGGAVMTPNEFRKVALNLPPIDGGNDLVRQAGQSGATGAELPAEPDGQSVTAHGA